MNPRSGTNIGALLLLALGGCAGSAPESYQGYVEGEFVHLASSQSGRLDHLDVQRGQQVAPGSRLFALEATDELAIQRQAQQQLAAAEAQLADLQSGKRPPEVAVVSAQLMQAQAAAQRSGAQERRDQTQYQAGGISREQLDSSLAQAQSDAARVRELQSQLQVARLPGREQQLQSQTGQVEAARAALAQADWRVDQKTVTAPAAGLVYDTLFRPGEWVAAGSPVVRLLPPQNVKIRFFVPESQLGKLALGGRISLHGDGLASDLPATITYVSAEAEFTPPVIYSDQTRSKLVFMIEAHPAPADASRLHPGQPVSVRIQ